MSPNLNGIVYGVYTPLALGSGNCYNQYPLPSNACSVAVFAARLRGVLIDYYKSDLFQ